MILNFKKMTDTRLKSWLSVYETLPMVRILIPKYIYKEAILEAYDRFKNDEMFRYLFFTYIKTNGTVKDFEDWYKKL
jgi:hypothetical protein